jgi:hypothetical protein
LKWREYVLPDPKLAFRATGADYFSIRVRKFPQVPPERVFSATLQMNYAPKQSDQSYHEFHTSKKKVS